MLINDKLMKLSMRLLIMAPVNSKKPVWAATTPEVRLVVTIAT